MDAEGPAAIPVSPISEGLAKLGLTLHRHIWHTASAKGLSATQMQILVLLERHAAAPLTLHDTSHHLGLSPATVSDAVRTLTRKGLVVKTWTSRPPRALALTITPAASDLIAHRSMWPPSLDAAVATLRPAEQDALVCSLTKLLRQLERAGDVPSARLCLTCRNFTPHHRGNPAQPHHCRLLDVPLAERDLRLDCDEHEPAPAGVQRSTWDAWHRSSPT